MQGTPLFPVVLQVEPSVDVQIHTAAAKTTLDGVDEFGVWDSVSQTLRKISGVDLQKDITLGLSGAWLTYGGTANAVTLTSISTSPVTALADGAKYRFKATTTNTFASTLAIDGLTAHPILTITGVALPAGYIRATSETTVRWDAAAVSFIADRQAEYGTNVNGEFWRYANGSQICIGSATITGTGWTSTAIGIKYSAATSETFAASFVNAPSLTANSKEGAVSTRSSWITSATSTTTGFSIYAACVSAATGTTDVIVTYTAIGDWYL